jgi:L-threonylcarbamoyladenylate synthase
MQTKLLDANQAGTIELAADLLRRGRLVAFPTDTVYGVGAHYARPEAIRRLYEVKKRPLEKGIPILLSEAAMISEVVHEIPEVAKELMQRFWPGPLTLVLHKRADLPEMISPNQGVAVRVPADAIARRLIQEAGGVVAASSANLSGERPADSALLAMDALQGSVAAVVDGGIVPLGQSSTVLDCTVEPPVILRHGPIPEQVLSFKTVISR